MKSTTPRKYLDEQKNLTWSDADVDADADANANANANAAAAAAPADAHAHVLMAEERKIMLIIQ